MSKKSFTCLIVAVVAALAPWIVIGPSIAGNPTDDKTDRLPAASMTSEKPTVSIQKLSAEERIDQAFATALTPLKPVPELQQALLAAAFSGQLNLSAAIPDVIDQHTASMAKADAAPVSPVAPDPRSLEPIRGNVPAASQPPDPTLKPVQPTRRIARSVPQQVEPAPIEADPVRGRSEVLDPAAVFDFLVDDDRRSESAIEDQPDSRLSAWTPYDPPDDLLGQAPEVDRESAYRIELPEEPGAIPTPSPRPERPIAALVPQEDAIPESPPTLDDRPEAADEAPAHIRSEEPRLRLPESLLPTRPPAN